VRRVTLVLLTAVLVSGLLSGCGEKTEYSEVSAGIENTNAIKRYNASFLTELTFNNGTATLLYQQGSYSIDREQQQLYSEYVRTYLGASDKITEMYRDGYVYLNDSSGKSKYESKPEFLTCLHYAETMNFNEKTFPA
jgi:outer membrane lipoprotein-sorting protein